MLNKKDPLISAVQQVMQRNNVEREAVKIVNEYFGVEDRRALPHERQGEWNAAYQQVLSEGNIKHPNQQKLDVHEPEKDQLTAQDFKMLRAKKKPMEEAKANPYAIGMAAVKKSTGDEPPMEKKNIKKAHEIAKKIMKKKMNEQISDVISEKAMGGMVAQKQKEAAAARNAKPGSPMPVSGVNNSSWFSSKTDMQRATQNAGKMDKLRRMQANPPALDTKRNAALDRPTTTSPMAVAQKRQDTADAVKAGRISGPVRQKASNDSGITGNPMGDYNPGQEYSTPTSPKSQAQLNTSPTVKTRPELPAPRQKAAPIKVSDTEVMNSPEFKKARQSVGGEAGARKIQTGTRVQGLGRFNKGDTIMSRTKTMLAAKKNVGRES